MGNLETMQQPKTIPCLDPRKEQLLNVKREHHASFPFRLTAAKDKALAVFSNGGGATFKENQPQ